jgi:CRISPR-associated protein Csb2
MPLTISLTFPAGRYVAASWDDKERVEWPPHPARLCLALVDALHRGGNDPGQRSALEWLCAQGAPVEIIVPGGSEISIHKMDGFFVPQNPSVAKDIKHPRKGRSFPTVFLDPDSPTVFFHWNGSKVPGELAGALSSLLAAVPRFGHSSSLVIATVSDARPPNNGSSEVLRVLDPGSFATPDHSVRIPWSGLLDSAEKAFDSKDREKELSELIRRNSTVGKNGTLPKSAASGRGRHDPTHHWHGYLAESKTSLPSGPWNDRILILRQLKGDRVGLVSTWKLAETFHKTLLDHWTRTSTDPVPSWLSGHAPSGSGEKTGPTRSCHLSVFPLPYVDSKHADGHILGIGIAIPKVEHTGLTPGQLLSQWNRVFRSMLGECGELQLTPKDGSFAITLSPETSTKPAQALAPARWTRAAATWRTVTPIVLDQHPKPHFKKDPVAWRESCQEIIALACRNLGLPAPISIDPSPYSALNGVPPAPAMPAPGKREGRPARFHIHATIIFPEKIAGPILLGAGRFRGYGLCLPITENSDEKLS